MKRNILGLAALVLLVATQATAGADPSPLATGDADKVDGLSAVRYTTSTSARRGKLVATNSSGYLPNNIIRDSAEFVKASGIEMVTVGSTASNTRFGPGSHVLTVSCPAGSVRTGGGYGFADTSDTDEYTVTSSIPTETNGWEAHFQVSQTTTLRVVVVCMRFGQ